MCRITNGTAGASGRRERTAERTTLANEAVPNAASRDARSSDHRDDTKAESLDDTGQLSAAASVGVVLDEYRLGGSVDEHAGYPRRRHQRRRQIGGAFTPEALQEQDRVFAGHDTSGRCPCRGGLGHAKGQQGTLFASARDG